MDLYLHESVLLLGLDDEKGSFSPLDTYLYYGFASALIMDLVLAERIIIEDKRVKLKTNALTENKLLNDVLGRIRDSRKSRKVTYWIHYLVQRIGKLKDKAIEQLIRQGILERRAEKILWVFNVKRYPSANPEPENTLRERLHQIIFNNENPEPHERMLLAIIRACKQEQYLIPDKEKRKVARERIKALTKDSEMRKYLDQVIMEMQAAVMVATTASI